MSSRKVTILIGVSLGASFALPPGYVAPACAASRSIDDICLLPPVAGDCQAALLRYYYDPCTAQCLPFTYGGCGGNANNFLTLEERLSACSPEGDVCALPADPGPCDGACPRFFHNICTGQCEPFLFGCCEGNANNFLTLEECEATCPPVTDICSLPGVVGPCEAYIPRYYYNAVTGQCESFIYGGLLQAAEDIPTVSEWGMVAMAMLALTVGACIFGKRRTQAVT